MESVPREVLQQLLQRYGRDLATDSFRLKGLLRDLCGNYRAEINVLLHAQAAGVPERLRRLAPLLPLGEALALVSQHMEAEHYTAPAAARWAVETWALALGFELPASQPVSPPVPPKPAPPPAPAPVPPKPVPPPKPVVAPAPQPAAPTPSSNRRISPIDGKEQVWIPAGEFLYGDNKRKLTLPGFWIDVTPVTQAEYQRFLQANPQHRVPYLEGYDWAKPYNWDQRRRTPPAGKEQHPVVLVSWHDAVAYAQWAGKRLPTEVEWEKAARGTDGREYPWGDTWDAAKCNTDEGKAGGTMSVGKYSPRGDSPYGCVDMAGNVWEWTASEFDSSRKVARGGSWRYDRRYARGAYRDIVHAIFRHLNPGFRCVW